jgi:hypothetical protein
MMRRKPSCSSPEQVLLGDEDVLEGDGRRVGGVPAELVELRGADALAGVDDEEARGRGGPPCGGRLDRGDVEARAHAIGDVGLLAVDDEAAIDALARVAIDGDVRARARAR